MDLVCWGFMGRATTPAHGAGRGWAQSSPILGFPFTPVVRILPAHQVQLKYLLLAHCSVSSLTGWLQSSSASTVQKLNFCYLVGLKPQLNKIHIPALTLSNGASVCPSPSARNLGFIFDAHLTFSDQIYSPARSCFYHIRDLRRIRPVLDFSIQPTSLAHPSYTQSSITATHCTMVLQKPS